MTTLHPVLVLLDLPEDCLGEIANHFNMAANYFVRLTCRYIRAMIKCQRPRSKRYYVVAHSLMVVQILFFISS